ncbi:MAG TPA: DUF6677 family protein, partial [Thermoanaerobaculia bacterium]|nr:DUF6677 family protein [Thermoanaerobaculia bacterium]
MSEPSGTSTPQPSVRTAVANPLLAAVLAWLVPGAGHLFLRKGRRALLFFVLVVATLVVGCRLQGNLYTPV